MPLELFYIRLQKLTLSVGRKVACDGFYDVYFRQSRWQICGHASVS